MTSPNEPAWAGSPAYAGSTAADVPAEPGGLSGAQGTGIQETGGQDTKEVAKQEAGNVAQSASGAAQQVAGTARDQAAGVASEAKEHARNLVGETRDQVTMQVMSGQEKLASTLRSLGEDLQSMAQGQSGLAGKLAGQAAGTTSQVAGFIEQREPSELLEELTRFARQRPGTFLIGSAVAGMLAGRLTRGITASNSAASSPHSGSYPPPLRSQAAIDMPAVPQSSYASAPVQTYEPAAGTTQSDAEFDRLSTSYESGTSTYASDWSDPASTTGRTDSGTGTVI